MADKNPLFAAKPDDPKDVAWALTTADTCWKRGDRSDALKWLRRAVEEASEAEADDRALELAKVAADLATQIGSMVPPGVAPASGGPPGAPAVPEGYSVPQRAAPVPRTVSTQPIAPKPATSPPPAPHPRVSPPQAKDPPRRDRKSLTNEAEPRRRDRKSLTNEAGPPKRDRKSLTNEASQPGAAQKPATPSEPPPRKRANSRVDRTEAERRAPRADEIDAWPTEVLAGDQVPAHLAMDRATPRDGLLEAPPEVRPLQAVRVVVWRAPDGSVQVTLAAGPKSSAYPPGAVEATLVAIEVDADLVGLLTRPS